MIRSISLSGFKSYAEATLPLAPLTFLVGQNASGKSNALEAVRFLSWLASGSRLDDIERRIQNQDTVVRGRAKDLFRDVNDQLSLRVALDGSDGRTLQLTIGVRLPGDQLVIVLEEVSIEAERVPLYWVDGAPNPHTDEIGVAYNNFARGGIKPHIFLDPNPASMRGYVYAGDEELREDGHNLSAALRALCRDPSSKATMLDFVRSLPEQQISGIEFIVTERSDVMVRLVETFGSTERRVDAPLLSDGTLRVLAIGAALLSAKKGTLLIVEEIDNGVHPSRADTSVRQIRRIAEMRGLRVLLASHNPALLDSLEDGSLGDVVCCYRDEVGGDSRLVRLGDLERFAELAAQGPLGELMTRRVLERFVRDDASSEDRRHRALDWLEKMSGYDVLSEGRRTTLT